MRIRLTTIQGMVPCINTKQINGDYMSKSKYTSGQWHAVAGMVEHENDDTADICSCYTRDFDQEHLGRTPAEEYANARLISAAPKYYEACKSLPQIREGEPTIIYNERVLDWFWLNAGQIYAANKMVKGE